MDKHQIAIRVLAKELEEFRDEVKRLKEDIENRKDYESWLQAHDPDTPMRCYTWWLEQQKKIKRWQALK